MGLCHGKNMSFAEDGRHREYNGGTGARGAPATPHRKSRSRPDTPVSFSSTGTDAIAWPSPYPQDSASPLPTGFSPSPARSTPRRFFRRPFPPPSPAKPIKASLAERQGLPKPKEGLIPEDGTEEVERSLDKNFGYGKNLGAKYELGKVVGRGHFGHTCFATAKKGDIEGQRVAVKIISKAKVRWYVQNVPFWALNCFPLPA